MSIRLSGPTALKRWVKLSGSACYPAFVGKLDKLNYPSLQRFRTTKPMPRRNAHMEEVNRRRRTVLQVQLHCGA